MEARARALRAGAAVAVAPDALLAPPTALRFTRAESDFADPDAYNDYLELIEDCVYNLTNGVDVEDTERRIREYEQQQQQQQGGQQERRGQPGAAARPEANGAAGLEPAVYDDAERRRLCAIAGGYDDAVVRTRAIATLAGALR